MRKLILVALFFMSLILVRAEVTPSSSTGVEPPYPYKGGLNEAINLFNGNLNVSVPLIALKGRGGLDVNIAVSYDSRQMKFYYTVTSYNPYTWYGTASWNYEGRMMGRWVANIYPYVKEYNYNNGSGYRWKAEITLEGGTQHQFDTGQYLPGPSKGIGKSINGTDAQYDFDARVLRTKSGLWYDFSDMTHLKKGDANGNYVQFVSDGSGKTTQIIDTLGRTVNISYDTANPDQVTQITVLNNAGQQLVYSFQYQSVYVNPPAHNYLVGNVAAGNYPVLSQINLPDSKTWVFSYYNYASPTGCNLQLSRVDYPTGGYSTYGYTDNAEYDVKIASRTINPNNGQAAITTSYSHSHCSFSGCGNEGDPGSASITQPDGTQESHLFNPNGQETFVWIYKPGGVTYKTVNTTWTAFYIVPDTPTYRKTRVQTYGDTNYQQLLSDATYQYDSAGNVTQEQTLGAANAGQTFRGRLITRTFLSLPNYIYRPQLETVYDLNQLLNTSLVSQTQYSYDQFALTDRGSVVGHSDAYGVGFTQRGNLTTTSRWLASENRWVSTTINYDTLGNVVQAKDARNNTTTIIYSVSSFYAYPTQTINAKGHTVNTNYSFYTGHVTSVTDANNLTTTTTYDSLNRVTRIDNPDTSYLRATYDLTANNFSTTVYKSVATGQESSGTTYLDGIGREKQKRASDPAGDSYVDTQYALCDCTGKTSKISNPYRLGETVYWTETQYDGIGRPVKIIPPDGTSTSNNTVYSYADVSTPAVTVVDPAGKRKKYEYDFLGRISRVFPDFSNPGPYSGTLAHWSAIFSGIHQHYFWGTSNPMSVNQPDYLFVYVYLDPLNPPSEIMLQWHDGTNWEHRAYWGANNIPWGTDGTASRRYAGALPAAGQWVRLSIAASAVNLQGSVDPFTGDQYPKSVSGMAFTLYGGRAIFDRAGWTSNNSFDSNVWVEDSVPAGSATGGDNEGWTWLGVPESVTYDYLPTLGQNKLVITQGVQTRTFNYDTLGRLTSEIHPENGTTSYAYDDNGNMTSKTDARGWVTNYTYDQLNRSTGKTYLNDGGVTPSVTLTYDTASNGVGQLATWATGAHSGSKTYDSVGRTLTETRNISASSYTAQWSYNLAGELLTTTYPNGWTTTNGYDAVGNLASIGSSFAGTILSSVTRNAAGQFTQLNYGNGVVNSRSYNTDLQLASLTVSGPGGSYLNQTYSYNAGVANNGRIVSITDNLDSTKSISYTYDALNRLSTGATSGSWWGLSWTYDRYGNRTGQTLTKGTAPPGFIPSLPADTNTNHVIGWTYDAANTGGNVTNDGRNSYAYDAENRIVSINSGATTYTYDAFGSRVTKTTGSTTIRYYFGLAENTNGTWTKILVGTAAGVIEWDNGTMLFKSNDHLGNARVVTGSAGTVIGRTDFYPYGEIWSDTGATSKYKFTGKERDTESGNDYFGARYYWNGAGRWLGADPELGDIYDPRRLNRYAYCLSDPINYVDPDGAEPNPFEGFLEGMEWIKARQDAINRMLLAALLNPSQTPHKPSPRERKLAGAIDKAIAAAAKEACKNFLNSVLQNLSQNLDPVSKAKYTIDNLLGAVQTANYDLEGTQSTVWLPDEGMTVGDYLRKHPDTAAVALRGQDAVYLNDSFFTYNNPQSVALHESFHVIVFLGNGQVYAGGFGASDVELAKAAGVYTNDKNASKDFQNEMSKNCK